MYRNNFILTAKNSSNQILRETNDGIVYLPFDSEYKLHIKNNNNRKALVKVKIDGTDVLGGNGLILNAFDDIDLERFILDGDLNKGKKFKFVPISDSRVSDPTNRQNGDIEVECKLEREKLVIRTSKTPILNLKYYNNQDLKFGAFGCFDPNVSTAVFCSSNITPTFDSQKGATIEGSESNQPFIYGQIDELESSSTILRLKILAPVEKHQSITTFETKKKYCTNCGKRLKFRDIYCSRCGEKQF